MAKQVTLYDIAQKMKVSTVTVSKALSGQKGVSSEVRARILQCAGEMGYTKMMHSQKPVRFRNIGVVCAERFLSDPRSFQWRLYQAIALGGGEGGYMTFLEVVGQEEEEAGSLPNIVLQKRVEGLIVMGEFRRPYRDMLENRADLPCVLLDAPSDSSQSDAVIIDNMTGGMEMTDYLFSLGHSRIGFFGRLCESGSIDDRFLGYTKSCFRHGVGVPREWILPDRDKWGKLYVPEAIRMPEKKVPTAWFCNCDRSALVLKQAFKLRGLSVPEDISLVGFDNDTVSARERQLTTYELNTTGMASRAVQILFRKLEDEHFLTGRVIMGGRLIVGESARRIGLKIPTV